MKIRNPLYEARVFLEYLESNAYNPKKRMENVLKKKFKTYSDVYYFTLTRHLIHVIPHLEKKQRMHEIEITIEGSEFLEKKRSTDREKESHKFQKQLVITSLILAIGVSFNGISLINIAFKELILPALFITMLTLTLYVIVNFLKKE